MIKFYQEGFGRSVSIFDVWKHKLNEDIIKRKPRYCNSASGREFPP